MRLRGGHWLFLAYVVAIVLVWGGAITARNLLREVKRARRPMPVHSIEERWEPAVSRGCCI